MSRIMKTTKLCKKTWQLCKNSLACMGRLWHSQDMGNGARQRMEIDMKYAIKLTTFDASNTAEGVISAALKMNRVLSHGTVIDIFAKGLFHKNGIFTSKAAAKKVAERINNRGAFGGFGKYAVTAQVEVA